MLGIKISQEASEKLMELFDEYRKSVDQTAPINNDLFVDKRSGETPKFIIWTVLDLLEKHPELIEVTDIPISKIK